MNTYYVYGTVFTGRIKLVFASSGYIQLFDFSEAEMDDKSLTNIFRNMPVTESEFIRRADGGGTKYEKL